jgi:energy-coupling factor transporter ATP-binding protein EcfA2
MKLLSFRVTNYRSVEDSGLVEADQMVCLVGKNEAGKTAILQALTGLNPHLSTPRTFDKETDYPRRHLQEYSARHNGAEAVVITSTWQLENELVQAIKEELGPDALISDQVQVLRRYGDTQAVIQAPINYAAVVKHLLDDERLTATEKNPCKTAIRPIVSGRDWRSLKQEAIASNDCSIALTNCQVRMLLVLSANLLEKHCRILCISLITIEWLVRFEWTRSNIEKLMVRR